MKKQISESFLHYIWRTKNFEQGNLKTFHNKELRIIHFGNHNPNGGPDFLNAQVEIDHIVWAGHIEIHVNSSDWSSHGHSIDENYNNVILHVVLNHDQKITTKNGVTINVLELKNRIPKELVNNYSILKNTKEWIPCQNRIQEISNITIRSMMSRVLAERLSQKSNEILELLEKNIGDWNETIYQRLAWAMGLSVNASTFQHLAEKTPLSVLLKHRDSLVQIEAILLGQSGILKKTEENANEYISRLKKEYQHFANKYHLQCINAVEWKFMRMRPSGFPTIRMVQLAKYLHLNNRLDTLLFNQELKEILSSFSISINDGYWVDHYRFNDSSKARIKSIGRAKKISIIINAIVPIIYAYGIQIGSQQQKDRAIELLEKVEYEKNGIISKWQELGAPTENAADSQSLLHLKKHYCDQFQCLNCSIGYQILKA